MIVAKPQYTFAEQEQFKNNWGLAKIYWLL